MTKAFSIDFEWLAKDLGNDIERSAFAEITICVNGNIATELQDTVAKTIHKSARLSAYGMALWFTYNWWRLFCEPERQDTLSWKMSHMLGSVGGGYLWPDLCFSSDGAAISITSYPTPPKSNEPIRYLNDFLEIIPLVDFKNGISAFIDCVIARLASMGIKETELSLLWNEVRDEERDKDLRHFRKLESIMGFDPGEAPDALMDTLKIDEKCYGSSAIEEMVAFATVRSSEATSSLWYEIKPKAELLKIPDTVILRQQIRKIIDTKEVSWKQAEAVATIVRNHWKLDNGPIETKNLCNILNISEEFVRAPKSTNSLISAGFRNGNKDNISVFVNTPYPANRRFAMARLIGDHLVTRDEAEKLLPATDVKTMRQTFQRAFAQEFLCPYRDLDEYLHGKRPTDEIMDNAAVYFFASPLMIRTILVNKGRLDRKSLFELE